MDLHNGSYFSLFLENVRIMTTTVVGHQVILHTVVEMLHTGQTLGKSVLNFVENVVSVK